MLTPTRTSGAQWLEGIGRNASPISILEQRQELHQENCWLFDSVQFSKKHLELSLKMGLSAQQSSSNNRTMGFSMKSTIRVQRLSQLVGPAWSATPRPGGLQHDSDQLGNILFEFGHQDRPLGQAKRRLMMIDVRKSIGVSQLRATVAPGEAPRK